MKGLKRTGFQACYTLRILVEDWCSGLQQCIAASGVNFYKWNRHFEQNLLVLIQNKLCCWILRRSKVMAIFTPLTLPSYGLSTRESIIFCGKSWFQSISISNLSVVTWMKIKDGGTEWGPTKMMTTKNIFLNFLTKRN